ncbi:MAG: hypothetical protein K8I27_04240 [Planctomycetes bacterium]|nr:hypothetical protein [Planctomycetota bacterium]
MGRKSSQRTKDRNSRRARKANQRGVKPRANAVTIPGSTRSFEVELKSPVQGFAAHAAEAGNPVQTLVYGTCTVDNGEMLYELLDAIGETFLYPTLLKLKISSDSLSGFVVVLRGSKAKVYLNPDVALKIAYKGEKPINKGEVVTQQDVADVELLEFPNVPIPDDACVVAHIKVQWRPVLYFDFSPNIEGQSGRGTDYRRLMGQLYAKTAYRGLFQLKQHVAEQMFLDGWFPFVRLLPKRFSALQKAYEAGFSLDNAVKSITDYCDADRIRRWSGLWFSRGISEEHKPFIESALKNYETGDYLATCTALMPRIEAIISEMGAEAVTFNQKELIKRVERVANDRHPDSNLFLPAMFKQYLSAFYFKNFNAQDAAGDIPVSRHSVAHGWVRAVGLDKKAAVQAFLILDQLAFLM